MQKRKWNKSDTHWLLSRNLRNIGEGDIKSQTCYNIACRIWAWFTKNQLWVSGAHIPGTSNIEVYKQYGVLEDATGWTLGTAFFSKNCWEFWKTRHRSLSY